MIYCLPLYRGGITQGENSALPFLKTGKLGGFQSQSWYDADDETSYPYRESMKICIYFKGLNTRSVDWIVWIR